MGLGFASAADLRLGALLDDEQPPAPARLPIGWIAGRLPWPSAASCWPCRPDRRAGRRQLSGRSAQVVAHSEVRVAVDLAARVAQLELTQRLSFRERRPGWPPGPEALERLEAVMTAMRGESLVVMVERVSSGPGMTGEPHSFRVSGEEVVAEELYAAGGATDVHPVPHRSAPRR